MLHLLILAAVCLIGARLVSSGSLVFEPTHLPCHRLPLGVRPTHYDVHLKFPSLDSNNYEGHVNISVKFLNVKRLGANGKRDEIDIIKSVQGTRCVHEGEPNQIVLHADERLEIQSIKVRSEAHLGFLFDGTKRSRKISQLLRTNWKQMIAIRLKRGVYPGTSGKITIAFKGKMRDDKRGIYMSTYKAGQQVYRHVVSQFQATDARTAFPCFDEPRFKTTVKMKISHPQDLVAYGNEQVESVVMDEINSMATTTFVTTPKMPVHMVGFAVGEFDKPLEAVSEYRSFGKTTYRKVRVITAPGKRHTAHFALAVLKRSLEWFEDYIDFQYPLSKLDIIAIADHERGNTETWGIGFVRDNLIWIDDETKIDTRITTAVNVAHIAVHQWFANLINAAWWPDLWITEGVAAQFSFRIVDELYPELQSEYFLRLATLAGVMRMDQEGPSHALSPSEENMRTVKEIDRIFDKIEFMKSGSLAQMVMDAVEPFWYQQTLRRLVADNAFGAVNLADYIQALTANGVRKLDPVIEVIRKFSTYYGVPLLNVVEDESASGNVSLSLESFGWAKDVVTDPPKAQLQDLAIYTTLTRWPTTLKVFVKNSEVFSFPPRDDYAKGNRYVQISGYPSLGAYYRTRYTDELYERLKMRIGNRSLLAMSRIQLLDDANALVQERLIKNDTFKSLLDSYANEDHGAVILQMLPAIETLASLRTSDTSPSQGMKAFLDLFKKYEFKVRGGETVMTQLARQATLTALIKQGNQEVTEAALKAYDEANGNVALFLREPVYTALVLSRSSQVEKLFEKLDRTKSHEERMRLVSALALSSDKQVLQRVQAWLKSSDLKEETMGPFLKTISETLTRIS